TFFAEFLELAKTLFLTCESLFIGLLTLDAAFIPVEDKSLLASFVCDSCVVTTLYNPGTGYSLKDKNKAKPDKTEHGFGKSAKN
ncbi:hypothetical protein Tco_0743556, partial [Tanacetum coccineum]